MKRAIFWGSGYSTAGVSTEIFFFNRGNAQLFGVRLGVTPEISGSSFHFLTCAAVEITFVPKPKHDFRIVQKVCNIDCFKLQFENFLDFTKPLMNGRNFFEPPARFCSQISDWLHCQLTQTRY